MGNYTNDLSLSLSLVVATALTVLVKCGLVSQERWARHSRHAVGRLLLVLATTQPTPTLARPVAAPPSAE
jgi:hypothetical protein